MRNGFMVVTICSVLIGPAKSASLVTSNGLGAVTPIIFEKNEGEVRVWRPIEGATGAQLGSFIFKVDRRSGGSSHLVFLTEDVPPGGKIDRHKHPGSDEIIFLQNGQARVSLGDKVKEVHAGATVFAPADTWIEVTNVGPEVIHGVFVFSAPGFDDFMRGVTPRGSENRASEQS